MPNLFTRQAIDTIALSYRKRERMNEQMTSKQMHLSDRVASLEPDLAILASDGKPSVCTLVSLARPTQWHKGNKPNHLPIKNNSQNRMLCATVS